MRGKWHSETDPRLGWHCFHCRRSHMFSVGVLSTSNAARALWTNGRMKLRNTKLQSHNTPAHYDLFAFMLWIMLGKFFSIQNLYVSRVCMCLFVEETHEHQCFLHGRYQVGIVWQQRNQVSNHCGVSELGCSLQTSAPLVL